MTGYVVRLGQYTVSNRANQGNRLLVSLVVELGMDGYGGGCTIEVSGTNDKAVDPAAAVSVDLDNTRVFTGTADTSAVTTTSQVVRAIDALASLARIEIEAAYQDVSAGFVARDLLDQARVAAGDIVEGPRLADYVLHRPPRALYHLRSLADLCGADVFSDGQGRVQVAAPRTGTADHIFHYGETVKGFDLRAAPPAMDGIEVWGEGAASSQGADRSHWLPTKLDGVTAKARVSATGEIDTGAGARPMRWQNGAVRSGQAAREVATARMRAAASRRVVGQIDLTGSPKVFPGDLVTIDRLPSAHAAAALLQSRPLRVRTVRHTLDGTRGLSTRLTV